MSNHDWDDEGYADPHPWSQEEIDRTGVERRRTMHDWSVLFFKLGLIVAALSVVLWSLVVIVGAR